MDEYKRRYEFVSKESSSVPIVTTPQGIQDSRFKFNIATKEPIKTFKLENVTQPVLLVPLKWNSKLERWELSTSDSWINATIDSNNYLNVHSRIVEQLPTSLSASGNLKISLEETSIKQPVDKQAIYRVQVIETTTALDADGKFISAGIDTTNYSKFQGFAYADQDGSFKIQISPDNSNWYDYKSYSLTGGTPVPFNDDVIAPYMRIVYTNGGTDQTEFRIDAYAVVL